MTASGAQLNETWSIERENETHCILSGTRGSTDAYQYKLNSMKLANRWRKLTLIGYRGGDPLLNVSFPMTLSSQTCESIATGMTANIDENDWPSFLTAHYEDLLVKLSGDRVDVRSPSDVCPTGITIGDWGYLIQRPGILRISSRGFHIRIRSRSTFLCMKGIVSVVLRAFLLDTHHFMVDLMNSINKTSST